jgi:polyvinyl alcohol dehydrogenase (cytochrome)
MGPNSEAEDPNDWPMYNRDLTGTRFNNAEKTLAPFNVATLVEKWRFPRTDSHELIGVIHATPVVVNGYVYFGTATDPAFYKLTPDGRVRWSYRNPTRPQPKMATDSPGDASYRTRRFQSSAQGIMTSALVTEDTVFFGDLDGWFYALNRETGEERWKLNSRNKDFPGAHALNCFFASPILADGKLIVAGGALEQVVAAFPGYRASTGRGFVVSLEPRTGKVDWKFDLGTQPQKLDPPITILDSWGKHVFHFGPATSAIWCTPSYDASTGTLYFGTDVNTAPRRPTADNPRLDTRESCAIVALDVRTGTEKWITQISKGDVWTNAMRSYSSEDKKYKDQSIGDTPKIFFIDVAVQRVKVVGAGCKNGGFYILNAVDGQILHATPRYEGPPSYPLNPGPDRRMLALPSAIGGLQTGCATDGERLYTNGIDALRLASQEKMVDSGVPPTGGRVVGLSLDTTRELWRHERPKVASLGGPAPKQVYQNVGDPVASGIAVANGVIYFTTVASGKLVALNALTGELLNELDLGPVWSGPSVSRARVYAGSGNTLFNPPDYEAYFPKRYTGTLYCFGLPGEDDVDRMKSGTE